MPQDLCAAGPCAALAPPSTTPAERVEGLVSREHSAWASTQAVAGEKSGKE